MDKATTTYANREARIRLTPKCNYHCFFCHEEGGCQAPVAEWESLRSLLLVLKAQRRRDITFTGGEPLLNKPVLLKSLAEIASWNEQPEVTVITNATLLDEAVIESLEQCRKAKVHVSIHDPRPAKYQLVTGQGFRNAGELKPILRRLSGGPVSLKLNAVLTTELVEDHSSLPSMLDYAHDVGADMVKFVELLVTKDASNWPMKGAPLESLNARFMKEGFTLFQQTTRTSYWRTQHGIVLEATRCACALGCGLCEAARADSFTGGTHYHPCFLSDKTIPMAGRPLEDVLAEGEAYLRQFIHARNVA